MRLDRLAQDREPEPEREPEPDVPINAPIVDWQEAGSWVILDVRRIWESRGGPIARGVVISCADGLTGSWAGRETMFEPGDPVNVGIGDADMPDEQFKPGRRIGVTFKGWRTAISGRRFRKYSVEDLSLGDAGVRATDRPRSKPKPKPPANKRKKRKPQSTRTGQKRREYADMSWTNDPVWNRPDDLDAREPF